MSECYLYAIIIARILDVRFVQIISIRYTKIHRMQSFRGRSFEGEIKLSLYPLLFHVGHSLDDPGEHFSYKALVNVRLLARELLQQFLGRDWFPREIAMYFFLIR